MKKIFVLIILFGINNHCSAQEPQSCQIIFSYTPNGERILRTPMGCRPAPPDNPDENSKQTIVKYGINAFPNPTSSNITVSISNMEENDKAILFLYDMQGKEVLMQVARTKIEQVDMSNLPQGNYFLRVTINGDKAGYVIQKIE
jgi:hypothetical protein